MGGCGATSFPHSPTEHKYSSDGLFPFFFPLSFLRPFTFLPVGEFNIRSARFYPFIFPCRSKTATMPRGFFPSFYFPGGNTPRKGAGAGFLFSPHLAPKIKYTARWKTSFSMYIFLVFSKVLSLCYVCHRAISRNGCDPPLSPRSILFFFFEKISCAVRKNMLQFVM